MLILLLRTDQARIRRLRETIRTANIYNITRKAPGGWYDWEPSSSSNFSIRILVAYPLIETRQTVPCRAIRGNSISVNSTLLLAEATGWQQVGCGPRSPSSRPTIVEATVSRWLQKEAAPCRPAPLLVQLRACDARGRTYWIRRPATKTTNTYKLTKLQQKKQHNSIT